MDARDKSGSDAADGLADVSLAILSSDGWRLLLDAIQDGISVHSDDGVIRLANRRIAEIYAVERDDLLGRSCQKVFHARDKSCPHAEVLASGRSAEIDLASDEEGHFKIRLDPLIAPTGQVLGYVRLVRDITERVRAQQALLRAERFATVGQMISGIAHDVGSPLSIISGYSEYLLMRTVPNGPGHKELTTIIAQTRRIAEFIRHLLDLARPGQPRADAIGLKDFINELLDLMNHHFKKSGVKAKLITKAGSPLVYGDSPKLRQALFNLLLNVSQRLDSGSDLEITLDSTAGKGTVAAIVISGRDGSGNYHDFTQAFSDFLRPDGQDRLLDLGLTLAKQILRDFGAQVEIVEASGSLAIHLPVGV